MTLFPYAQPFFSCTPPYKLCKRNDFLSKARVLLSFFDFNLLSEILTEWENSICIHSCFSTWQKFAPLYVKSHSSSSLHVLSFNVRGLDLRWQEVLLLSSSLSSDVLILLETGLLDVSFFEKIFNNFRLFYQKGENRNGGVLVLVRRTFHVTRIECKLPNVCVIDIKDKEVLRVLGVYAPESKSWVWQDLSSLLSKKCVVFGDFNVDLSRDGQKTQALLAWADDHFLAPFTPDVATSLRSNRVIDYALACGTSLNIQTYSGNTTSDHIPIVSVIPVDLKNNSMGKNVHWKVFSLFTEYTFSFWEGIWDLENLDVVYSDYSRFLFLLNARCTIVFPLEKYRPAIPVEMRLFLSYIRALSFRQMRTKSTELKNEIHLLRKVAKSELKKFFSSQLSSILHLRNTSSIAAASFWSKSKSYLKPSSSSVHAFIDPLGQIIKDTGAMCELAADFYENFFKKSDIVRPHPYTDSPLIDYDNVSESIPEVTLDELLLTVQAKRKKKSVDAHGISNFMFNFLDLCHWSLFLKLFNHSFQTAVLPRAWKDTRVILLAKKESICLPSLTRPISLIDSILKVGERLFLTRFRDVLLRRGLLPDNQSGFRDGFRLQTRLLLFLEDIYSLMVNSAPVCTIFIDFRSAFDQLWHSGCIGKLRRLGIPPSYLKWIEAWLLHRRCFIEMFGCKSRWFSIEKGGPQGSVLTPTLFITFHCDMGQFLSGCTSHFFADDVAAILAGQLGIRYSDQCLDLEKRVKSFLDKLELYSRLADQPLNRSKTEALFSARAIGLPKFNITFNSDDDDKINWRQEYKYLGYIISSKLGWGKLIKETECKVRKRVALIRSFKLYGCSSPSLRKALFYSHVLPIFTWIYPIYPLLTRNQQDGLSKFYYTSLRRTLSSLMWNENLFAYFLDELSLEDRCSSYWNRYLITLSDSLDGSLIFEKANFSEFRKSWLDKEFSIRGLRRSKRFITHQSILEKVVTWLSSTPSNSSVPYFEMYEIELLHLFPDSFC
jgi:hypothetical protein